MSLKEINFIIFIFLILFAFFAFSFFQVYYQKNPKSVGLSILAFVSIMLVLISLFVSILIPVIIGSWTLRNARKQDKLRVKMRWFGLTTLVMLNVPLILTLYTKSVVALFLSMSTFFIGLVLFFEMINILRKNRHILTNLF
jgi:hypothetical protein